MVDDLIVITCASGKQCSHLIPNLYETPSTRLRLVVNSENSLDRLQQQYPSAEVIQADLTSTSNVARILQGATAVYHVGPSFHAHETQIGYQMIDAAIKESKQGGFKHFVYSSVLNSQIRKMLNHDCKRYVEEYLIESGLNYSILQPTHFMDSFPIAMLMQMEKPVYHANWDPSIAFSSVALRDLGEASAKVLKEREKHYYAQYALCSTGPETYEELVATAGKVIGRDIKIEQRSYEDAVAALLKIIYGTEDVPLGTRDGAQRMVLYYNFRGLVGSPNVLEWLLGRKPTSRAEWARLQVEKIRRS